MIGPDPVATFYLPFTRAFELLAGAVLFLRLEPESTKAIAASNWRAWTGMALIAASAAILDHVPRLSGLVGAAAGLRHAHSFCPPRRPGCAAWCSRARHWCGSD